MVTIVDWAMAPRPREIPGADKVLPTARITFSTGNVCDLTSAKANNPGGGVRMLLCQEWRRMPTEEEKAVLLAEVRSMGLPLEGVCMGFTPSEATMREIAESWLGHGVRPQ